MGLFEQLPYTNFHDLNLTELIKWVKALADEIHDFEIVNQISYGGVWDITKQYTKYTIVTVNGTDGYISLKPVPSGIDITNSEYWVVVADFTTALAGLGARVSALESEVNYLETKPKRRYILVGDSFSLGVVGGGAPQVTGWAEYAVPELERINERAYRYHPEGGEPIEGVAGFAGGVFIQYLQRIESDELDCDNNEITDIVVLGGSNEFSFTQLQIEAGIDDFCQYCDSHFPNAHVSIGLIGLQADRLYNSVRLPYMNASTRNGAHYIDTCLNLMLNPAYDSGYGHITEAGYNYINPYVLEAIRFGKTSYVQTPTINLTLGTDVSTQGTFDFKLYTTITEKSIKMDILDSARSNRFALKLANKSGTSLTGQCFTLASDVYFPNRDVCDATAYLCDNQGGYQYTPVRSGHVYIDNHNELKYSFGFPYNYTWSGQGIDNANNDCFMVWDGGSTHVI